MDAYGYTIVGNSKRTDPDYIPSLIGIDEQRVNPNKTDIYFERLDLLGITITAIAYTRWVTYDSFVGHRDPILEVRADTFGFYIPLSELTELAGDQDVTEVITMLSELKPNGR